MEEINIEYQKYLTFGKNAEHLFKMLVESTNEWDISKFGMESFVDVLKNKLRGQYCDVSNKIRLMPDYVLIHKKTKLPFFFEVKRSSFVDKRIPGKLIFKFQYNQLHKINKYWPETKLFIVHQEEPYFYIIDMKDINFEEHLYVEKCYANEKNLLNNKNPMQKFDFFSIVKDFKDFFPSINDDALSNAVQLMISK